MLKSFAIFCLVIFSPYVYGKDIPIQRQEGTLQLGEFLDACEEVATITSSKFVPKSIPGKVISIKNVPYEIRFFSFEDTSGKLTPHTTFRDYATQCKLLTMKSKSITVLPGICFESFDFHQNPIKDGVYFSMAIRKVEK